MFRGTKWALQPKKVAKPDARSALWGLLDVYQRRKRQESVADLFVRWRVCSIDGVKAHHFLKAKGPSNGSKHVEAPGKSRAGPTFLADNHQQSLYLLKISESASRTRFVAADGSICRLLLPRARREHLLLFVHM